MGEPLPVEREDAFWSGVENARRFFMGTSDVQQALERLAQLLDEKGIPYAVIGAMALNEWGYRRVTVGVDVLLTAGGCAPSRKRSSAAATPRSSPAAGACATPSRG